MPDRILIVRLSHLGDVVHALGVFHAVHAAYPAAEIGWVVQEEFAGLLRGLPGLGRIFLFGRRDGWRAWPRLRRELRDFAPDLTVDAQANAKSAGVTWCSGAERRVGLARRDWRERLGSLVINDPAPPHVPSEPHAMDRTLALVRHLVGETEERLRIDAGLTEEERAAGEAELDTRLPAGDEAGVLLHLSSPGDIRGWMLEGWRSLTEGLAARNRRVLIVSGPTEADAGRELEALLEPAPTRAHWIDQRGLRPLSALFEAAARRGMRIVACDSGPLHLAVASGLDAVALAGPQDERRTGPWLAAPGARHRVVRARPGPDCAPCCARRCDHRDGAVCMAQITPEQVLAALDE